MKQEEITYFPVLSLKSPLRFAWATCEVLHGQRIQVRVNEQGIIVACSLAHMGCRVFKGMPAPWGRKCLIGEKGG